MRREWGRTARWTTATVVVAVSVAAAYLLLRPADVPSGRVYLIGYEHSPPFQITDERGRVSGIAVETLQAAARRAGIALQWIRTSTSSTEAIRGRQVDLWPLMADVPERRGVAYVTDPWGVADHYLVTRAGGLRRPERGFSGTITFSGPAIYHGWVRQLWPAAQTRALPDPSALPGPMCSGEAPIVFISSHRAALVMREVSTRCPEVAFQAEHLPELTFRMGIGSTPEARAVADRLRAEILRMSEDGELGDILVKYAYVGLTEAHTILQLTRADRQSRVLRLALIGLALTLSVVAWLFWRLRRARRVAEAANAARSEFLANISHEIRTPLGGVLGMVELALDQPSTPQQREYLDTARSSADVLLAILNDVLDFSRVEARRLDLLPVDADVRQLVTEVSRLLSPVAQGKRVRLLCDLHDGVPATVRTDPVRLRQILLNLVGNALKFTHQGSVKIEVTPIPGPPPLLLFQISDTGIGIPPEKQQEIFEPFRQADGSTVRRFGGSGLGLTIAKQLVTLMGGQIWCESTPGFGSTFSFTIACGQAAAPPRSAVVDIQAPSALRVLVAEDNRVNQKLVRSLLERDGHEIVLVEHGYAAVAAIRDDHRFDVVLMDVQMPEMDGLEATAAIRALDDPIRRHVPIVALTAHAHAGYADLCLSAGMDFYLTKPINPTQLRDAMTAIAEGTLGRPGPARRHSAVV